MSAVPARVVGRRVLLLRAGRGALGIAVLGLAACTADDSADEAAAPVRSGSAAGLAWSRVDLAYVSAFVLVRGREAAVVDTGFGGEAEADRIGAALSEAGPGWDGVRHVVITHAHGDHFGGLAEVARRAARAELHAGGADLREITSPPVPLSDRPGVVRYAQRLRAVGDGDEVLGLQVVATPGHTPGHVALFDADSRVLVAGDALLNTVEGQLSGAHPRVSQDPAGAADSVRKLAALEPRLILLGHGPPVERDATVRLQRLAGSLP